jgi:hypothetical protein
MSSMWTSSMNKTPGTISALPSSRHSATFWSICSRRRGGGGVSEEAHGQSHFRLNLARITRKEREEALGAGVDDVHFVQGHDVDDLFALLELPLRALDELGLSGGVRGAGGGERWRPSRRSLARE